MQAPTTSANPPPSGTPAAGRADSRLVLPVVPPGARRAGGALRRAPWRDHAGKFSPLKSAILLFTLYPAAFLFWRWQTGALGGRPITEATHRSGDWAVYFLLLALAISPTRAVLDWSRITLVRRMFGVAAALYAGLHLLIYCLDQKWNLWVVVSEIVKRFYLTIGFTALLGLATLAGTSTNGWQKRLRQRWKKLHRMVYPLACLALFHYFLQSKINVADAVFYTGIFVWLMLWRLLPRRHQTRLATLAALAPAAMVLTAAIEIAWYGLATKVSAWRVLDANLGFDIETRPASQVATLAALVVLLAGLRRLPQWWRARAAAT